MILPDLKNIENQEPINAPDSKKGFIYVPSIKLYVSEEKNLHGKNWYQTHKELHKQNLQMLTIKQFAEFLKFLKENPNPKHEKILDEILTVREPWRAEWLDAYFEERKDGMYILTKNKTKAKKLSNYLDEDREPGIDLDYWLKNATSQRLPPKNTPKGSLYYWCPEDGRVARFYAYSDRAVLDCYRDPGYSDWSLGVRSALAHAKKI